MLGLLNIHIQIVRDFSPVKLNNLIYTALHYTYEPEVLFPA